MNALRGHVSLTLGSGAAIRDEGMFFTGALGAKVMLIIVGVIPSLVLAVGANSVFILHELDRQNHMHDLSIYNSGWDHWWMKTTYLLGGLHTAPPWP